ncbi:MULTISPECIES: hypothetical protein [unclassified Sphingomonas]|uniref:hypothetical protein n=1 Tax=unclassified Sphingomonas TaxID=196159 RepID=UPI00226A52DD|nr:MULTISPECIES: hypothetical protein [unclassified Sphingomonas]
MCDIIIRVMIQLLCVVALGVGAWAALCGSVGAATRNFWADEAARSPTVRAFCALALAGLLLFVVGSAGAVATIA